MKKAFTFLELVVVIVIMGILSTITFDILARVYDNYMISKEFNHVNAKVNLISDEISAKLRDRLKNSVIGVRLETNGDLNDFMALQSIHPNNGDTGYTMLEWINKNAFSKRGMWSDTLGRQQCGWSGLADLGALDNNSSRINTTSPKEFRLFLPNSNFDIVQAIDCNETLCSGSVFDYNETVLIFSGGDNRGDFTDINSSYGWYGGAANKVFALRSPVTSEDENGSQVDVNITSITVNDDPTLYEYYFLTRSAYAIRPIATNVASTEFNLTLYYNYQPWQGEVYSDGNQTILATSVSYFRFKEKNGVIRIYVCVQSPDYNVTTNEPLTACVEKVVH